MRIWLIQIGEPLPTDGPNVRLMRVGQLAEVLAARGHEVTWWAADFDHTNKRHRTGATHALRTEAGYRIVCLHSPGYRRNVGPGRLWDHWVLGRAFRRRAAAEPPPDAIFCAMPTIELSAAAADYGQAHGVPVVLDIRDLWPDLFVDAFPRWVRPLAWVALGPYRVLLRRGLRRATGITALTTGFLDWGQRRAGRPSRPADRVFPLGYTDEPPAPQALEAARKRWDDAGLTEGRFIACYFGAIGRMRELGPVIEAARQLRDADPPIRIVICGDGESRAGYVAQAADCPNMHFPGWVSRAEIAALMERSAVGLAPYVDTPNYQLNIPNKVVEYLAGGLPVLSAVKGAVGRLLSGHQCGATYADGKELAAQLTRLRDDAAERERMAANAGALFREQFIADSVYADLSDYLEQLAADGRQGRGKQP